EMPQAAPVLVPGRLAEQQRQALGRRDQEVRRVVAERAATTRRGVPRPDADRHRAGGAVELLPDGLQRFREVAFDVVTEALERRDIYATQPRLERPRGMFAKQPVEDRQERGECLARSR